MKLHIDLRKLPWDFHDESNLPFVQAMRERLNELFADYQPKRLTGPRDGHAHELTVPIGDAKIDALLAKFDTTLRQSKQPVAAGVWKKLEPAEVKHARFVPLVINGDDIDVNNYSEPLNPVALACGTCKFPDITRVPKPLLVNKGLVKKQDIMKANTVLIVRPPVLDLLQQAIGDQIEVGDVRFVVKGKPQTDTPAPQERLHWVRPRAALGEAIVPGFTATKRCPTCKRVIDNDMQMVNEYLNARGPGVHALASSPQHFGQGHADLAVIPPHRWDENTDHAKQRHWSVSFAISGALLEHLKSAKVKGIGYAEELSAMTSDKGDETFVATVRSFTTASAAAPTRSANVAGAATPAAPDDGAARREAAVAVAALKDVPWDYDADGYVYFHLSSPEVVMLDPMTWEQDDSGPHRVKGFKKPGLYRMPVTAIRGADAETGGVAVDSATLLLIDANFFADLQEAYDWDKATDSNGKVNALYHQALAEQIGTRFGLCTTPPAKFKSEFIGDGFYTLNPGAIGPAPHSGPATPTRTKSTGPARAKRAGTRG
jgi:hypothetical protein